MALSTNLPVSNSGRGLGEIFVLLCPNLYEIDKIEKNGWGEPVVEFSKNQPGAIAVCLLKSHPQYPLTIL